MRRYENYGARSERLQGNKRSRDVAGTDVMEKLKEDHIFGKFENIVRVVDRRLRDVRIWSWRA